MLKFSHTLLLLLFFATSFAQAQGSGHDSLSVTLTKVFKTVKQNSVYGQQVDWNTLENSIFKETSAHLSFAEFKRKVKLIFAGIGDKHAALFIKGEKIIAADSAVKLRPSLLLELQHSNLKLHTQILNGKYGYILVPHNSTKDNLEQMAQGIQDSLCKLMNAPLKGIIIDLRSNEGGSVYPLFTGLHQLIGEGNFGAFTNLDGSFKEPWKLKKGKFIQQNRIVASVKSNCSVSKKLEVAVLLSQVTASAGEMVAIALKGRENTIFIGEQTYGLTTGNVTFKIDGHLLAVSASFTEDRTGKRYSSYVMPDIEIIEGDNFSDLSKDRKIIEAMEWFDTRNSR